MKNKKSLQDLKDIAYLLNTFRLEHPDQTYSPQEIDNLLKGILPTSAALKGDLVSVGVLVRIARGKYCFPGSPIHWKRIEAFYQLQREKQRSYKKSGDYLYGQPVSQVIDDLKTLGYWVFKKM